MANLLIARESFVCKVNGVDELIREGDLFDADHPVVKKYPANFREVVLRFPMAHEPKVEQATAAPGQKRNVVKRGR